MKLKKVKIRGWRNPFQYLAQEHLHSKSFGKGYNFRNEVQFKLSDDPVINTYILFKMLKDSHGDYTFT